EPDDPVGVPDAGDLRIDDDQRSLGGAGGGLEARFDTGRAVDEHAVEVLVLEQCPHRLLHPGVGKGALVASLRGGQKMKVVDALVTDYRLAELATPFEDVDEVIDDPALQTHDDVEVAQADVGVD